MTRDLPRKMGPNPRASTLSSLVPTESIGTTTMLSHPFHSPSTANLAAGSLLLLLLALLTSSAHCFAGEENPPQELEWDALIPADYRPDKIMSQYGDISEMDDNDPRAQKILDQLQELWDKAPIVTELHGQQVKLPGFVVPLEGDGVELSEFFLVPYYGACIHVPPPPANQIVYVKVAEKDVRIRNAFDTVWVTGTLSAKSFASDLGNAGYQLTATQIEPYEE